MLAVARSESRVPATARIRRLGYDSDAAAVAAVKRLFERVAQQLVGDHVRQGTVDTFPGPTPRWTVISSAVLHFARDADQFRAMADEMWRVVALGGLLFARLATSIGLEHQLDVPVGRWSRPAARRQ